jgi:hypothetical protein
MSALNERRLKNVKNLLPIGWYISLHFVKIHAHIHLRYGILVLKYKNVAITSQQERENPLKIRFCFQTGDKIVSYVSTRGDWDCTTLQHHCTTFGFTSGYTEVLRGGTISMPTGRHVDNLYYYISYINYHT